MLCLNCGCSFNRRPTQQYFCSRMCWEDASKNTPWRILSEGLDPVAPTVPLGGERDTRKRGTLAATATKMRKYGTLDGKAIRAMLEARA